MPGYDRATKEIVRTFAVYGYAALMPNLHHRYAPGAKAGDAAAAARDAGGVPDEQCLGDVQGAIDLLRGAAGVERQGRRDRLLLGRAPDVHRRVHARRRRRRRLLRRPGRHRRSAPDLRCPLLGLFGDDDQSPSPDDVAAMATALEANGKTYDFHSYDGAGHAFFSVDRPRTGSTPPRTAGSRSGRSSATHLKGDVTMCTYVTTTDGGRRQRLPR